MKTCLFASSYLDGYDGLGSSRLDRTVKWLNYYWPLRKELGFDHIVLVDNASSIQKVHALMNASPAPMEHRNSWKMPGVPLSPIVLFRFDEHLAFGASGFRPGSNEAQVDYPFCWRALWEVRNLITKPYLDFGKIIAIDTDGFVLTKKLAHAIRDEMDHWETLYCPRWQFPDAAIQVIGEADFDYFLEYTDDPWRSKVGRKMENELPFTTMHSRFKADRFGETLLMQTADMDYYGQCPFGIQMKFKD